MADKSLIWLAVLISLIALIFIVIAIIAVRATWDDPERREFGALWLYLAAGAIFITGLMTAVAAEMTPNLCQLPYSGSYVPVETFTAY